MKHDFGINDICQNCGVPAVMCGGNYECTARKRLVDAVSKAMSQQSLHLKEVVLLSFVPHGEEPDEWLSQHNAAIGRQAGGEHDVLEIDGVVVGQFELNTSYPNSIRLEFHRVTT